MSLFSDKKNFVDQKNTYGLPKLPGGQLPTDKFPVLTYGQKPNISIDSWRFKIFGMVESQTIFTWNEFLRLPQTKLKADFHCVTHWSRFDDVWEGVMFKDIWEKIGAGVSPKATHVMQHAYGGYTTNLPLQVMLEEDVMFVHTMNGQPLSREHGGPLRTITPKRYAWKGAKWVNALQFMPKDTPGFWEQNGYSNTADPWKEERYW